LLKIMIHTAWQKFSIGRLITAACGDLVPSV